MALVLTPYHRELMFKFDARTSRGAMQTHQAHFLRLNDTLKPAVCGWGEASPLPGLSPEFTTDYKEQIQRICAEFNALQLQRHQQEEWECFWRNYQSWPSLQFAWETALVDLMRGGKRSLYPSAFSSGQKGIRINGLIWMGDLAFMREQIEKKLEQGFTCIKLKIGGLDFTQELKILKEIRSVAGPEALELRLDANGAFSVQDAEEKLRHLAKFHIHSLEQPIKAGQLEAMQTLCGVSPIPIALDEELIGVTGKEAKWMLLDKIRPAYIIIKPTLVGGLISSRDWIQVAESLGIDWWLTSALESNIGLNAIAQFAADSGNPLPQGLGTGQLYHNNLNSPLEIRGEELWYNPQETWELPN
ncbi:o-succinylbenzoate synthase [Rufibacter immobilis]|uniref:o-succinylbenzoate synthase n=1 Tax=Rufibacter immobilis TaxID=1348778 RepID=A0A3M9MQJ4_9BACT|nr:o-succinylbenzoate synthase [Rufibacter immobilis]RNI27485.1 o-succinylbenzoate synthase [Rufibacter immobilis]